MILGLLLLFAQAAAPDVRSLLQSSDPSQQAWGAWHAGQSRMYETIPVLAKLVGKRLPEMHWVAEEIPVADRYPRAIAARASSMVVDAALDALIKLEAKIPADLIAAIYQERPAQALVLMSNLGSNADPLLLKLATSEQGLKWFCAANLLLAHCAGGFAFLLLKNLSIRATIALSEDGSQHANSEEIQDSSGKTSLPAVCPNPFSRT